MPPDIHDSICRVVRHRSVCGAAKHVSDTQTIDTDLVKSCEGPPEQDKPSRNSTLCDPSSRLSSRPTRIVSVFIPYNDPTRMACPTKRLDCGYSAQSILIRYAQHFVMHSKMFWAPYWAVLLPLTAHNLVPERVLRANRRYPQWGTVRREVLARRHRMPAQPVSYEG